MSPTLKEGDMVFFKKYIKNKITFESWSNSNYLSSSLKILG